MNELLRELLSKVVIGTDEELENCDAVACVKKKGFQSPFDDNVTTTCAECGEEIIHRPYIPAKPPKVCMECIPAFIQNLKKKGESSD